MLLRYLPFLIMSVLFSTSSHAQNLSDLLPDIPAGWKSVEDDKLYNSETLYDYINGGAELYLSYGMKNVISRIITNEKGDEIRIEIFNMTEAKNAYGVFTHTRTINEKGYGQGSQYFPGTQIFWKGKYYISIMATDDNEEIQSILQMLSSELDTKITSRGEIPKIINYLPEDNLEKDGFVYFHHYIWLNSYYYIANDNFLDIDEFTNAVLAKYGEKDNRSYLLIIEYPDSERVQDAYTGFATRFLVQNEEKSVTQIEDGTWLGGTKKENYFIAVFNASSKTEVDSLLKATQNNIQQ